MEQQEIMQYLYEVFDASLPRLGPGDTASTIKAINMLLPTGHPYRAAENAVDIKILDIGCGNGAQTIQLAKHLQGTITALDNHRPFLTELMRRAKAEGVGDRIRPYEKDMHDPGLTPDSFQIIWAEGSLYSIDFNNGLTVCRDLLAPEGLMAVTELCWLKEGAPEECLRFFAEEYPAIKDVETNLANIKNAGYDITGYFTLPESAWLDNYYTPLEKRLALLEDTFRKDPRRMEFINKVYREIDIYRRHSEFYGYVFYLMQRR
ncbi:MAG: class I SAM-dependent methyltransferase [Acidobacteria bacterium]|nr:class I SAM-dependent methyltransferase [Acidobacteriota bacterium]